MDRPRGRASGLGKSCITCIGCSPTSRTEKSSKLTSPRSNGKGKPRISPKVCDQLQARKFRELRTSNNISSKKCRENKKRDEKITEQYEADLEEKCCLFWNLNNWLEEKLRERKIKIIRMLVDCPYCKKSPYIQRFIKDNPIEKKIAHYEELRYYLRIISPSNGVMNIGSPFLCKHPCLLCH